MHGKAIEAFRVKISSEFCEMARDAFSELLERWKNLLKIIEAKSDTIVLIGFRDM